MFRRSRLSIRPNVGTGGRTAGLPQETSNKDQGDANSTAETPLSGTDNKSAEPPTEHVPSIDQNEEPSNSSAIQRRKRFSVRPKVVPGRPSALPRTPKSPIKPLLPPGKSPAPVTEKAEPLIDATSSAPHKEQLTPKEHQSSEENSCSKKNSDSPPEGSSKSTEPPDKTATSMCSQAKETSPKAPVPPSIPDREALDISEKAKTLVSKTELKSPSHFSLTQLLNDKSDLLRLEKARKLRQLLKQEMLKEKGKKYVTRIKEHALDPAKMTMRDLIHYLPTSNPMSSTTEDSAQDNEADFPQSPGREISPDRAQEEEAQAKTLSSDVGEGTATTSAEAEQEHEEEEADEAAEDEDALMVPQVKVAEDGSLIIDEESLTVEVQRMKGPNPISDRDPIFERGSTTTYSSFRKGTHTKAWSTEETDMFFLAISMVGTDFAMISQLFPHRNRTEIKNKFKKEERFNAWRIDKAFRERRKLDLEYFKKLLDKVLEFQQSKKLLKSKTEKPKARRRKAKGKKTVVELSDVEEENEDRDFSTEEQEGEKENLCNVKNKRKLKDLLSSESPVNKKKRKREKKKLSDDATSLVDLQQDVSEDRLSLDQSTETDTQIAQTAEIKSRKPRRCKEQKAKKSKSKKADVSDGGETAIEETEGQQSSKTMSGSDSDHKTAAPSTRPSRYGRIPKPVQHLNYSAKEDSASDTVASPTTRQAKTAKTKTQGKRRKSAQQKSEKESKKPKLITLRASQSEGSDDDDAEEPEAQQCEDENSTGAFVPASLCSPKPVIPEVEETMEELDILPDVLGMSQNALCPDESDPVDPCEHQLDLLVDVIDFLSEHTDASGDESYNEAAQTLLAIGNQAQSAEAQIEPDQAQSKFEGSHCSEEEDIFKSSSDKEDCTVLYAESRTTDTVPTNSSIQQPPTSPTSEAQVLEPCEELSNIEKTASSTHISATKAKNSLPAGKGRLSKIKPKPNIRSATRTTKVLAQTSGTTIESQPAELKIAETSQQESLRLPGECSPAASEPSKTCRPGDDRTVGPMSPVSTAKVSSEPGCQQDITDSPPLQTTPDPTSKCSPSKRGQHPKIKPDTDITLGTKNTTVEAGAEMTKLPSEISNNLPVFSHLGSSEHQEESNQDVSAQGETCSTQGSPTLSQRGTASSKDSSAPRKGRLSKIKPKPNIRSATRTTKVLAQTSGTTTEIQPVELKTADTSQQESLRLLGECSSASSEPSKTTRPGDDTTVGPMSPVSTAKVSSELGCQQDIIDSPPLQTTPEPTSKCSPSKREQQPKTKLDTDCTSGTKETTVGAEAEMTKLPSEISNNLPVISHFGSSEHQEESNQDVSAQGETCSTQGSPTLSQRETASSKDSSAPRKGRLKLKPKPNLISCASRATKLSSQSDRATEVKIPEESKMTTGSGVESSQQLAASNTSNTHTMKRSEESNTTQETPETSQLETPGCNNSVSSMKERPSSIHHKTSRTSVTSNQSLKTADSTDEKPHTVVLPQSESVVGSREDIQQESLICGSKKTDENITPCEPEIITSNQKDSSEAEEKNRNFAPVQTSDPGSESLKPGTPQRRRWVPKAKPKLNLASSSRTAKPRLESKEKSEAAAQFTKSSLMSATPELPMLQDSTADKSHEDLKSPNTEEVRSASSFPSKQDISLRAGSVDSSISTLTSTIVSQSNNRSAKKITNVSKTELICEDPTVVQEQLGAEKRTNLDHSSLTESALSESSTPCKPAHHPEPTPRKTEICLKSKTSNLPSETSEISALPTQPAEGAVEPPREIQHDAVPPADSGQIQTRSPQNSFEYKSLLFPNIPPDQVPSDPNEPFFILSLTEIPVCPSGEELNTNPESFQTLPDPKTQQSNPLEPVVLLATGIDDSLSNIHIPTPEKATLKSGPICMEEYLPSTLSVDISLLEEPQERRSIRRPNLREAESSVEQQSLSGDRKPGKSPNLTRKRVAKETDKPETQTQDRSEHFTHIKSFEVVDSVALTGTVGSSAGATGSNRPTSNVLTKDDQFTSASSELLDSNQGNSTNTFDEGPTNVAEYFFGDVFTEVESDCSVTEKMTEDPTQGQPAKTKVNLRQLSNSPCGQKCTTALQKPEATADGPVSSDFAAFSTTDTNICSSQQESKTRRGRGRGIASRKTKTQGESKTENSRPQRKSKATKLPQEQESTPSCSAVLPQTQDGAQKRKSKRLQTPALTSSSIAETPADSNQAHTKTRKEGSRNSQSQKKSIEELKTPEAIAQSSLEETPSTSSAVQPQKQGSLSGSTVVGKKSRNRKDSPSPSLTQEQEHEGPVDRSQVNTEETKHKEISNSKNKASHGTTAKSPRPQKQDTMASKSPLTIKDNISASSSTLQASNQTNSKESSLFDDEPTNVSQYFLSDIFTDVDEEFKA